MPSLRRTTDHHAHRLSAGRPPASGPEAGGTGRGPRAPAVHRPQPGKAREPAACSERRHGGHLAAFVEAISGCGGPEECCTTFVEAVAAYGVTAVACVELDLANPERNVSLAVRGPQDWADLHRGSGPTGQYPVAEALRLLRVCFTWRQAAEHRRLARQVQPVLSVLEEHGWSDGMVVPIPRGRERYGVVGLACAGEPLVSPGTRAILHLMAVFCCEHLRGLSASAGFARLPAHLSQREVQCLQQVALGLSDRAVAAALGLSPATVHEHVERIKRKLGAKTRAEAVAIAVSLGIVLPD